MDPYANSLNKYKHLYFKLHTNELLTQGLKFQVLKERENKEDAYEFLLLAEFMHEFYTQSKCPVPGCSSDTGDPLLRDYKNRPRCRAHLLMVEMPMEWRRQRKRTVDARLELLMEVA